jgi:hypothetical protein
MSHEALIINKENAENVALVATKKKDTKSSHGGKKDMTR